jgi:hypothetical protein
MPKKLSRNFFKKNGKILKGYIENSIDPLGKMDIYSDQITSLSSLAALEEQLTGSSFSFKSSLKTIKSGLSRFSHSGTTLTLGSISIALLMTVAAIGFMAPAKLAQKPTEKYFMYASKPLTLEASSYEIMTKDSRSQRINEIFKTYNCPLQGFGEEIVNKADQYNIPWWLVASISIKETRCGKDSPKVDGQESFNAWGWGVYPGRTLTFDSWEKGIDTVSTYLNNHFYSKGITDLCEIEKVYTPPSGGAWCNGVKGFGDLIQNYNSPQI